MIQTMYGKCIHSDLQKAMAEHSLFSAFHLFACNTENVIAVLNNGMVKLPCVTPFVQSKYIVNPKVSSYKTTGVDGAETVHSFDFTSTMPVNLFVQFTILANNISDIEEMEKFLLEQYSPSHNFSVSDFMTPAQVFTFTMNPDGKKEIERSGADVTLAGQQQKLYQSVLHFRCDRCVEVLANYSAAQLQLDTGLQNQLVKRIVGLDAAYDHFSKANQNSADLSADAITYAQASTSAVSAARATLVKALNIPAAYAFPQMVSKLYSTINDTKCDLRTAIEKLDNQEKTAARNRAAAQSRADQIQALKDALDLSIEITFSKGQISALKAKNYDPKPAPPVLQQIPKPQYPPINPTVPFWTVELLPALIFWPWIIIYYFTGYKKKKEAEIERIRNTPEYRQQCAAMDEAVRQKQDAANEQYRMKMKEYQEVILPKYEKAFAEWTQKRDKETAEEEAALHTAEQKLAALYNTTKIVPTQYRTTEALRHIYDVMQSSNYTIQQAIEDYNQAVQQRIAEERLRAQQAAYEEARRRADAEERRAEAEEHRASSQESSTDSYYGSGGILSGAVNKINESNRRKQEMREEMYRQQRMLKDYYNTPKCQRYGLGGKKSCAGCPIAHMCKH